jgi:hypothetical protein
MESITDDDTRDHQGHHSTPKDAPSDFYNIMAQVFLWILLAGFLILPSSFPNIQTIVKGSGTLTKVLHDVRNAPAYVPSFPLLPVLRFFQPKRASPALYSFLRQPVCLYDLYQQTGNCLHLLRHRHDRAVRALVEMVAQIRLAPQHYLHPRDVQWPVWRNLDIRWHLWRAGRCTLRRDNNCHCRRYRRVLRHLWFSSGNTCDPETSRERKTSA